MSKNIRLVSLEDPSVELARLDSGVASVGRESDSLIVIPSTSVSRDHAELFEEDGYWFLKDKASTNGSWLNDKAVEGGQLKLLRHDDVLRFADYRVKFVELEGSPPSARGPGVLVFVDGRFEKYVSLQTEGAEILVGGSGSQYPLPGTAEPQLTMTSFGGRLELSSRTGNFPVVVNGLASSGQSALNDRDEIDVAMYKFVVNHLKDEDALAVNAPTELASETPVPPAEPAADLESPVSAGLAGGESMATVPMTAPMVGGDSGWESEAAKRRNTAGKKFVFGTERAEESVTSTMGVGSDSGFEMAASQRFMKVLDVDTPEAIIARERRQAAFGVFVVICSVAFVVYCMSVFS